MLMLLILGAAIGGAPAAGYFELADWSKAHERGWIFRDAHAGGQDGRIQVLDGRLSLEDDRDGKTGWAEASLPQELAVADRVNLKFRARFRKLGMADEGTGNQAILRLLVGLTTPRGPFGINVSLLLDRYNVDAAQKVYRTDGEWHDWRLEIDSGRKSVALFRDGEYICLHEAGSAQAPGIRLQLQGSAATHAHVEFDRFSLEPAERHFAEGRIDNRRPIAEPPPGDWPLWRRDLRNTAISPLAGTMKTAPAVAWSHAVGSQAPEVQLVDLDGDRADELLVANGGVLAAHRQDGSLLWQQRLDNVRVFSCADVDADGERELIAGVGTPQELQILSTRDGRTRFRFQELAKPGIGGVRLVRFDPAEKPLRAVVWSNLQEVGYCLSFAGGVERPSIEWTFDWKKTFFAPCTALADMDRDGRLDLVVVTYNTVFVYDTRNGQPKITFDWNSGRNYGTLVVKDVDADGWLDLVMLADSLREHVAVIRNEQGQSLRLLWDKFYEQNYPEDHVSLRILTESVDDFDGDGRTEVAYSVYDDRLDERWRTLVVDAVSGQLEHELPGYHLTAAARLFPGRPPVLLLSKPTDRGTLQTERLEVWASVANAWRKIGELPPGKLNLARLSPEFPPESWVPLSGHSRGASTRVIQSIPGVDGPPGVLVSRDGGRRIVFLCGDAAGVLSQVWERSLPQGVSEGALVGLLSRGSVGNDEARLAHAGADGRVRIVAADRLALAEIPTAVGPITNPLVARLKAGEPPSILFIDGENRLNCLRSPGPEKPAERAWSQPGHAWQTAYVPSLRGLGVPHVADVDGDGHREVLVARDPDLLVALDSSGRVVKSWKFPARPVQWTVGRFDDDAVPDLLVSYPTGAVIDLATVALSGKDSRQLWRAHCGNGSVALHDLDGDGIDDVIHRDLYERRTLDGRTGRDLLPIIMQPGNHTPALPRLDPRGAPLGIWWLGGHWSLSGDGPDGRQLWNQWTAPTAVHAIGDVDGDGQLELGGVTAGQLYRLPGPIPFDGPDREFQCHDLATGRLKWSLPLGTTSTGVVTVDVDGDGRHEFLLGTADGRLIALSSASAEAGRILWEVALPATAGVPVVCDADGDGALDILVSCADGKLYCLSAAGAVAAKR